MAGKRIISWDEAWALAETLAPTLQGDTVWGVPRGGAVVAGMLSRFGVKVTPCP